MNARAPTTAVLALTLATAAARQLYRRDFAAVSHQLGALERYRRARGVDGPALEARLAHLARRLAQIEHALAHAGARVRTLREAHGESAWPLAFGTPAPLRAPVVSPVAVRYLALLRQADLAFAELEAAWLLGLVDAPTRQRELARWRREVHGLVRFAGQCRREVARQVAAANPPQALAQAVQGQSVETLSP